MRKVTSIAVLLFAAVLAFAVSMPNAGALAAETIAVVERVAGQVSIDRDGARSTATEGLAIEAQDTVITAAEGAVGLRFTDGAEIALGPETTFRIQEYRYDRTRDEGAFKGRLSRGTLSARSGRIAKRGRDRMLVETPSTILGVRGTRFMVKVDD
ncbi:MAG: FecR domain-containing protein [Minwuia sp.]|nr:FecR domain-containing protein [Minwuia sp.]